MRVYNLTNRDLHFRKSVIPPNGGSKNFTELDDFVPDSDKELANAKVISFGELPKWWLDKKKAESLYKEVPVETSKTSDNPPVEVELGRSQKSSFRNKRR